MAAVFHLGLTVDMLQGATVAIVPGDPGRVERIAATMDRSEFLAAHQNVCVADCRIADATL